jgi:cell division protease FtsH
MIQTFPTPEWAAFAQSVIDRLRQRSPQADAGTEWKLDGQGFDTGLTFDMLSGCPGFDDLPAEVTETFEIVDEAPAEALITAAPPPAVRLPLRVLSMAIRLAATFRTEAAFVDRLRPGAVTLLEGILPDDIAAVELVLASGLLPSDWRLSGLVSNKDKVQAAVLVRPDVSEGEVSAHSARVFLRRLDDALESDAGILILRPACTDLPRVWRDGLPVPVQLAPLSQAILILQLRHSHGAASNVDEAALRHALPSDHILATLPYASLRLATRELDSLAVAGRLAQLTAPRPGSGIALRDLVGYGRAKDAALGIVEDLAAWSRGDLPWTQVSRGLLLSGPPGIGKTELARAMTLETGLTFVSASYAGWQKEGHLGDFLKAVSRSFATAIAGAPAVIFIDEIDAFSSREHDQRGQNSSYSSKAIAGLLEHLDGVLGREGVVVIAATNHPGHIDPAIMRAGRFDRHIAISLPNRVDLAVILRQHLGQDLPNADLERLAALALGQTGADIAAAVRNARAQARRVRGVLCEDDLCAELSPPPDLLLPATVWRAAVHEAGHAIVIAALDLGDLTCLKLDGTGGACLSQMFAQPMTSKDFHRTRMTDLAGRAAERLVLGDISCGAGGSRNSDLGKATLSVLHEEMNFGMGALGSLWIGADPSPRDILLLPQAIQRRISQRIDEAERAAGLILQRNHSQLVDLATALVNAQLLDSPALQPFLDRIVGDETTGMGERTAVPGVGGDPRTTGRMEEEATDSIGPTSAQMASSV